MLEVYSGTIIRDTWYGGQISKRYISQYTNMLIFISIMRKIPTNLI